CSKVNSNDFSHFLASLRSGDTEAFGPQCGACASINSAVLLNYQLIALYRCVKHPLQPSGGNEIWISSS
ncbi:hypothetical protein N8207_01320, partial [Planktomarina temperata]|nr:hypothetical protein [Planktomarina temperata]